MGAAAPSSLSDWVVQSLSQETIMRADRMRIVERVLRRVIEEELKFDMGLWLEEAPCDDPDDPPVYDDCGTAACAAGWTARDPEAQAQGLQISRGEGELMYHEEDRTHFGCSAMARWLDVDQEVSFRLFTPGYYEDMDTRDITPQMVLERVQEELARPSPRDARLN